MSAPGEAFAQEMGLRYVRPDEPGFSRRRRGKSFLYFDSHGKQIRDEKILKRIRALVLPPAWEEVWICRFPHGHLQATGRDARGRKQYRYHADWSRSRNETKFTKLEILARHLPAVRRRLRKELMKLDLTRNCVLGAVVQIMLETHMRVGNEVYAAENESYGLTTIRNHHARVFGPEIRFRFKGKSGVLHESSLEDRRLSRIIRRCQELPGEELFAYLDADGKVHDIRSEDVNAFLREITGAEITAKDFRTWAGTVHAAEHLHKLGFARDLTQKERKARECAVVKQAACELGNTSAVCRKYYVHPAIFEADRDGTLEKVFARAKRHRPPGLSVAEAAVAILVAPQASAARKSA